MMVMKMKAAVTAGSVWPTLSVPGMMRSGTSRRRRKIAVVVANEPILPAKLASKEAGAGLPPVIPPGLRAVSVRVNEVIGVAGYVLMTIAAAAFINEEKTLGSIERTIVPYRGTCRT